VKLVASGSLLVATMIRHALFRADGVQMGESAADRHPKADGRVSKN
jgi:hypothetical protein